VAKHGKGSNVYLIRFHYLPPRAKKAIAAKKPQPKKLKKP
jgi:hypothetical protein